jgi:hypothetical protein
MTRHDEQQHYWWLTPTALFRSHAAPVFLEPRHWLDGCWTCASRPPHQQELIASSEIGTPALPKEMLEQPGAEEGDR